MRIRKLGISWGRQKGGPRNGKINIKIDFPFRYDGYWCTNKCWFIKLPV